MSPGHAFEYNATINVHYPNRDSVQDSTESFWSLGFARQLVRSRNCRGYEAKVKEYEYLMGFLRICTTTPQWVSPLSAKAPQNSSDVHRPMTSIYLPLFADDAIGYKMDDARVCAYTLHTW